MISVKVPNPEFEGQTKVNTLYYIIGDEVPMTCFQHGSGMSVHIYIYGKGDLPDAEDYFST